MDMQNEISQLHRSWQSTLTDKGTATVELQECEGRECSPGCLGVLQRTGTLVVAR